MPQHKKRIQYIDRLRGLAVLGMFFVHPAVAWMTAEAKDSLYFLYSMRVSGIVAPTFLTLAGISVALIADSGKRKGISTFDLKRRVAVRGWTRYFIPTIRRIKKREGSPVRKPRS